MRPAQKARDNGLGLDKVRASLKRFNEARAKSTG